MNLEIPRRANEILRAFICLGAVAAAALRAEELENQLCLESSDIQTIDGTCRHVVDRRDDGMIVKARLAEAEQIEVNDVDGFSTGVS